MLAPIRCCPIRAVRPRLPSSITPIGNPGTVEPAADKSLAASRICRLHKVRSTITPLPFGWRLCLAPTFQLDRRTGRQYNCEHDRRFEQVSTNQLMGDDLDTAASAAQARYNPLQPQRSGAGDHNAPLAMCPA